ncbi:MAG: hypothetical protein ACE5R4_15955 [Armatimonadota bacterium]
MRGKQQGLLAAALTAILLAWLGMSGATLCWCQPEGAEATDEEAEDVSEEDAEAWADEAHVAIGFQSWSVEGNERRFRQYVTREQGVYPAHVGFSAISPGYRNWLCVDFNSISEPGRSFSYDFHDTKGGLQSSAEFRRSQFFQRFLPGSGSLEREDWQLENRLDIGDSVKLDVDLWSVAANGPNLMGPTRFSSTEVRAEPYVTIGDIALRTAFRAESFNSGLGRELGGDELGAFISVLPAYDHRHMLEGSFATTWTDLDGPARQVRSQSAAFDLTSVFTNDLVFEGAFFDVRVLDSVALNSLEVQRTGGRGALHYSGIDKVWVETGAEFANVDYLERFQTRVDEPSVQNYWARAHYRPTRKLKLYGEWRLRKIDDVPNPTLNSLLTGPPVLWNESERWEAKATYTPSARAAVTGRYRSEDWRNEPLNVDTQARTAEFSGWWMPCDRLTVFGAFQRLDWDLNGVDGPVFFEKLDYRSNANIYTGGVTYQVNDKNSVSVTGAHTVVQGASRANQEYIAASWRHDWKPDCGFEVTALIDEFNEAPTGGALDFDADLIGGRVWHTF